jgi:hypothetical protein
MEKKREGRSVQDGSGRGWREAMGDGKGKGG